MLARVRPGGALAVQMPDTRDQPSHVLMRDVASELGLLSEDTLASASASNEHDASAYAPSPYFPWPRGIPPYRPWPHGFV